MTALRAAVTPYPPALAKTPPLTLDDNAGEAPSFSDDTGDGQDWTVGTAITPITVPEADGDPTPTYAVSGTLPAGIAFDTATRVISGTPTAVGSGTVRIQASNSEGNADWSFSYTTEAAVVDTAPTAPNFRDLQYQTSSDRIRFRWTAPDDDGGQSVIDYRSEYHNGDGNWVELDANQTGLRSLLQNPPRGYTYSFRVRARNSVGSGPYAATETIDHDAISVTAVAFDIGELDFAVGSVTVTPVAATVVNVTGVDFDIGELDFTLEL